MHVLPAGWLRQLQQAWILMIEIASAATATQYTEFYEAPSAACIHIDSSTSCKHVAERRPGGGGGDGQGIGEQVYIAWHTVAESQSDLGGHYLRPCTQRACSVGLSSVTSHVCSGVVVCCTCVHAPSSTAGDVGYVVLQRQLCSLPSSSSAAV
jgi:hypothetical protein